MNPLDWVALGLVLTTAWWAQNPDSGFEASLLGASPSLLRLAPSQDVANIRLSDAVSEAVSAEMGRQIAVNADNGTVVLDFEVEDAVRKVRVVRLVRQIPGVAEVIDRVRVRS